jgi:hypothetical protein
MGMHQSMADEGLGYPRTVRAWLRSPVRTHSEASRLAIA